MYEVGEEFYNYFPEEFLMQREGKLYFDLADYSRVVLQDLGIVASSITIHPDCSYQDNDKWWSRRRGDLVGRNFMGVLKRNKNLETRDKKR